MRSVTRMNQAENKTVTRSHFLTLIAFHTAPTAIQIHVWKIIDVLKPAQAFNGSFVGTAVPTSTYKFTLLRNTNVTTYVSLTYLFLV